MQKIFKKNLYFLLLLVVITSKSVFCSQNILKENQTNPIFTYQIAQIWQEIRVSNSKNSEIEIKKINNWLRNIASNKDTLSYLTLLAVLQKYHFANSHRLQCIESTNQFDVNPYFTNAKSVLIFSFQFYKTIYLVILACFLALLLLFSIIRGVSNARLFLSANILIIMLFISNWHLFITPETHFIFDPKYQLFQEKSFASKNCKLEINTGELMLLKDQNELWLEVEFQNMRYFIPQSQRPFLF